MIIGNELLGSFRYVTFHRSKVVQSRCPRPGHPRCEDANPARRKERAELALGRNITRQRQHPNGALRRRSLIHGAGKPPPSGSRILPRTKESVVRHSKPLPNKEAASKLRRLRRRTGAGGSGPAHSPHCYFNRPTSLKYFSAPGWNGALWKVLTAPSRVTPTKTGDCFWKTSQLSNTDLVML